MKDMVRRQEMPHGGAARLFALAMTIVVLAAVPLLALPAFAARAAEEITVYKDAS